LRIEESRSMVHRGRHIKGLRIAGIMLVALMMILTFNNSGQATEGFDVTNENARLSYSAGYRIGIDFRKQEVDIDPQMILQGAIDAIQGWDTLMTPQEMRKTMTELQKKMTAARMEKENRAALENSSKGDAFLRENSKKKGVTTLPSGLQYEVIMEGEGDLPVATDTVTVHYRGTLIDGTEFDSSYGRNKPATFALNRVIKGWTEGLQLMKPGAQYRFFIPPDLAYGNRGAGSEIGPNSTLVFEVELLSVKGK
jgi:FKBP-type peptidyl-prolyl cis-trans isomerase FklB